MAKKETDNAFTRYLYIFFLVGGFFTILVGKSFLKISTPWIISSIAIFAIVFYGFFSAYLQRHSRLRIDRIGDNCYYLGLTYTLASLIAALNSMGDNAIGSALLENFGVALMSTATGIIMRLSLMQFRSELDDAETSARLRLIDASEDFRQQLFSVKADLENFQTATFMSIERTNTEIGNLLKTQAQNIGTTINGTISKIEGRGNSVDELLGGFENEFGVLESYIRQMGRSAEMLAKRMDEVHANPKAVEDAFERLSKNLDKSSITLQESIEALREKAALSGNVEKSFGSFEHVLERISGIAEKMERNIEAQAEAVARNKELLETQTKSLESYTQEAEAQGVRMRAATEEVYGAMGSLAKVVIKGAKGG